MNPTAKLPPVGNGEVDWRELDAHALEAKVVAIQNCLAHLADQADQADHDGDRRVVTAINDAVLALKGRRDRLAEEARELRSEVRA